MCVPTRHSDVQFETIFACLLAPRFAFASSSRLRLAAVTEAWSSRPSAASLALFSFIALIRRSSIGASGCSFSLLSFGLRRRLFFCAQAIFCGQAKNRGGER